MAMGIAFVDNKDRFLMFNQSFVELWNIPEDMLHIGIFVKDLLPHCIKQIVNPDLDISYVQQLTISPDEHFDCQIYMSNGKVCRVFSIPVHTLDGEFYGRILQIMEISEVIENDIKRSINNVVVFIEKRRKIMIVNALLNGAKRFSSLKSLNFSAKVLTHNLRAMEAMGLIHREVYTEIPPRVEYSLTGLGQSLKPILEALWQWEKEHGCDCIQNKWEYLIVNELLIGTNRFGDLKKQLSVNPGILTEHLFSMETKGLIQRRAFAEIPPRVEYSLTELGHTLKPIFEAMWEWEAKEKLKLYR